VTVQLHRPRLTTRTDTAPAARGGSPMLWLGAAAVLFFLVPFIGTDWLGLQADLYYLGYFTVAVAFFAGFVITHASALRPLWTQHLWESILIGALAGAALAFGIFAQAATPHPDGWRFGFQIVWRGLIYGSVDALTLYVLPAAVAYLLMRGNRQGLKRKAGFAGLALVLSLLVTTTYHLGYSEYRGETMRNPEIGALVANILTALTGNPLGAVVTHSTMHVAAVVHQNEGGAAHMLPPTVSADYASHGSSDVAAGLAAGWLLATAGALTLLIRRQRTTDPTTNEVAA
jgi:formate/nitrite transporter FocA (FNT family)